MVAILRKRNDDKSPDETAEPDPLQREWFEEPTKAPTVKAPRDAAGELGRKGVWVANGIDPGLGIVGSSNQLCGLNPFQTGAGVPTVGIPIGRHATSNQTAFWHPFDWITKGLVTNPNLFILANLGVGKSAVLKRIMCLLLATTMRVMVLGDVKNEYGTLIEELGGQRWKIGHGGVGSINPLDQAETEAAAAKLRAAKKPHAAESLERSSAARRAALMGAIAGISLGRPIDAEERCVLAEFLPQVSSIGEFLYALEKDDVAKTHGLPQGAIDSVYYAVKAVQTGGLSGLFTDESSSRIDLTAKAMQIDISAVYADGDQDATALAMLAVWTTSLSVVAAHDALAAADLEAQVDWFGILDELWMAMRSSEALVRAIDAVMRTSRTMRFAPAMTTHSVKDFASLPSEPARNIAHGFLVRSGTRLIGSVEPDEAHQLQHMLGLSDAERNWIVGGRSGGSWKGTNSHPDKGKFLLHTGSGRTALPLRIVLSDLELDFFDTDRRT